MIYDNDIDKLGMDGIEEYFISMYENMDKQMFSQLSENQRLHFFDYINDEYFYGMETSSMIKLKEYFKNIQEL